MKLAIRFGDNDFHNTFIPLLRVLLMVHEHTGALPKDKAKLCFLINSLSPALYVACQNTYEYNGLQSITDGLLTAENEEYKYTAKYLQITPEHLLLDAELDVLDTWCNSEVFILDTEARYVYCL